MSTNEPNRSLGGISSALIALWAIPSIFTVIINAFPQLSKNTFYSITSLIAIDLAGISFLIGAIAFLIAIHRISNQYNEPKIFTYIIFGIVLTIFAMVAVSTVGSALFIQNVAGLPDAWTKFGSYLSGSLGAYVPLYGIATLIFTVAMVYSLNLLAAKSQVKLFKTSGKVFLAGALVQVIVGITFAVWASYYLAPINTYNIVSASVGLIQYVGWALLAIAFFKIPSPPTQMIESSTSGYSSSYTVAGQTKYCIHCGAPNRMDAAYCERCGKKQ